VTENLFRPTHRSSFLGNALLVFGPKNLPGIGRGLGDAICGFKMSMKEGNEDETAMQSSLTDHKDVARWPNRTRVPWVPGLAASRTTSNQQRRPLTR
jgi:TatA/E family protein of Tat protein translocase